SSARSSAGRCGRTGSTWARPITPPLRASCRGRKASSIASMWPRSSTKGLMPCEKKITRAHKAGLSKAERKEFRSLMWEFRRDPSDLARKERRKLKRLFAQVPALEPLYRLRLRFKRVFDTAPDRVSAQRRLVALEQQAVEADIDLTDFFLTYAAWKEK